MNELMRLLAASISVLAATSRKVEVISKYQPTYISNYYLNLKDLKEATIDSIKNK